MQEFVKDVMTLPANHGRAGMVSGYRSSGRLAVPACDGQGRSRVGARRRRRHCSPACAGMTTEEEGILEATPGIEPGYTVLQTVA
jgi:hypothetical protein